MEQVAFSEAVKDIDLVLCNRISEVDEDLLYNCYGIGDFFKEYNEDAWKSYDDYLNNREFIEFFQFFITDASQTTCNYLNRRYGLLFAYSELLDVYVLLVDHCGSAWSSVMIDDKGV